MTREISGASDILRMLLHFQNQIRLYHWSTKLYPRHVASGELYEKADSFNDKFVEIYQGKFNGGSLKGVVPFKYESIVLDLNNMDDLSIIESLNEFKLFLADDLYKWLSNMPHHSNTDLKNLVDELMGNVNQTLYLFTLS
jgi:hypothetical protein